MNCETCFRDFLCKCNETIQMKALLEPNTTYRWVITDKFDKKYENEFTTDDDGLWEIPVVDLPPGLLTEYSGEFLLEVFSGNCTKEKFKIAQEYDCVIFSVKGGTFVKDTIGCEFECFSSIGANSELIPFENLAEVDIDWTPERLALYGSAPRVQVHHLVDGTTFELVSVPVQKTYLDDALASLTIVNPIPKTGYVLIS